MRYFLSVGYFSVLFYLVFLARRRRLPVAETDRLNLVPFKKSIHLLSQHLAFNYHNVYNFYPDLAGNLLLFIPFPACMAFLIKTYDYKKLVLLAFIASISIECTQYILHIGVADIDDVILNTAGALIGIGIVKFIKKRK